MTRESPAASEAVIVRTGLANLASVEAAFARLGARTRLSDDPREIDAASAVILPGVGAFGAAMRTLDERGLTPVLAARLREGRPTLAICLGMQLLCDASEETPGVRGLGVVPGVVSRFPASVRVPHMGWNRISVSGTTSMLESGFVYFANSYRLTQAPPGWSVALAEHAGPFVAAIERGPILACQFHPELSGAQGLTLLSRWLEGAKEPSRC